MSSVVSFVPEDHGFPVRAPNLSVQTPLVSLFSRYPELLPFVRYLLNEHGIFTVADWDERLSKPFDDFELAEHLKTKFKNKIGRPARPPRGNHALVRFRLHQSPV